ncbi:sodium/proton antiporter NhaB [Pseudodesulfovibrio tunisiensis]|uniref:sodium/proton antiporter NhaB n=1 Tax=Pseudodesulfovibrio tunisiensis TaxID=463192 RepID=UPI001FB258D8|nr:sodium/proton antiporter NhaB [Pseudodesulfovibrio tunisiensis]
MVKTLKESFGANFLGNAPGWYKRAILAFLVLNPILLHTVGPFVTGWVLIAEFIFTLAMALKCYPLPAGGLLAIEAVFLGMTTPAGVYHEAQHNFEVILLLIFMVAGIHFMKDFLQFTFTRILVKVRSKIMISLLFSFAGAFLSAFLDALTVTAVIIAVAYGFYNVYHRYASGKAMGGTHDLCNDELVKQKDRADLVEFRGFLRNLMMHGAVGTALGGVCTLVGEPQNLLIASEMGWHFADFFIQVAPISMPVLATGLLTCVVVEKFHLFSYGYQMPGNIRSHLLETATAMEAKRGPQGRASLVVQGLAGVWLVIALAMHLAEVGIIGLSVIVLLTALTGITEEGRIGHAFEEALPFTALLVVFFSIVAVIHDQHLFRPVINYVLNLTGQTQLAAYYLANGLLSMISDNVFVATVYISETKMHFVNMLAAVPDIGMTGQQLMDKLTDPHLNRADVVAGMPQAAATQALSIVAHLDKLAVAINTGTNIPSVATPNGQAAFLFLLTSALAPVIRLSYGRMVLQALPYTITMSLAGLVATWYMEDIIRFFGG